MKALGSQVLIFCALAAAPLVVRLDGAGQRVPLPARWSFTETGPGAPGPDQQVLRITTRLVVVNVVVHDKKGAPVAGLTRDDFTVFDGGKREEISVFAVESGGAKEGPLEPLPPNVFSNRVARQGGIPTSVAVILLDGLDTPLGDQAYARSQLIRFLAQIQPQDRVALYVLGRSLSVIQDFTDDSAPLLKAIRQYGGRAALAQSSEAQSEAPETGSPGVSSSAALAESRLDAGLSSYGFVHPYDVRGALAYRHLRVVLNAFEGIAGRLSGLPGHKALIWVTGSVPAAYDFPHLFDNDVRLFCTHWPGLSKEIVQTAQAVRQADLAVYPVNARGLVGGPAYSARPSGPPSPNACLFSLNTADLGMNYIAQRTGGRAFYNTNDLKTALRTALDDSQVTYTLGYYPSHAQWDGRYRSIKVRVKRPGVEARYRQGYYASAQAPTEKQDRIAELKSAALNPLEGTGVGVRVKLAPYKDAPGEPLGFNVYIDARGLTFRQEKGLTAVSFDLWAGQYSNQGDSLAGVSKTVSASLKEEDYRKILRLGGLDLTLQEKIESGAAELRVVVRDGPSGSTGSVKIPLHQ